VAILVGSFHEGDARSSGIHYAAAWVSAQSCAGGNADTPHLKLGHHALDSVRTMSANCGFGRRRLSVHRATGAVHRAQHLKVAWTNCSLVAHCWRSTHRHPVRARIRRPVLAPKWLRRSAIVGGWLSALSS
jgi:hypothetical protein